MYKAQCFRLDLDAACGSLFVPRIDLNLRLALQGSISDLAKKSDQA